MTAPEPGIPRLVLEDDQALLRILRRLREWLWRYPSAAGSLVRMLVAEGRRFAETPQGARWRARLSKSDVVQRGRMVWSAYGLDRLLDDEPGTLPSEWLEMLARTLEEADLEETLATMMMEEARSETLDAA